MVFVDTFLCDVPNCRRRAMFMEAADVSKRVCREHRRAGVAYAQVTSICSAKVGLQTGGGAPTLGLSFFLRFHCVLHGQ